VHELAPMQSPPHELHFDKAILHTEKTLRLGIVLLRRAHRICKSQADTWTETPGRYKRFYDKQNKVHFHTFAYQLTHLREFSYTFLWTLILRCLRREVFGVSCPIADLIVGVQTAARAPFVSLFQVLTAEEGERWNRSEGAPEAQFVDTHEGDPSQPAGTFSLFQPSFHLFFLSTLYYTVFYPFLLILLMFVILTLNK